MANPALKNGYLSIANELVEKLASINIPGGEIRILWTVWRKTWGWQEGNRKKDWDYIAISQFENMTKMKHSNVVREIKSLVVKRILLKSEKGYKFNQNYEEWVVVKRIPPVVKRILGSSQKDTKSSSQKDTHNRKKETNTKEKIVADATVWNFEEELKKLKDSPEERRDLKIIALYWKKKGWVFENKKQFISALKRELRPAGALDGYKGEQIAESIAYCQREYKVWTLETIFKRIQDLVNKTQ